MKFVSLRLLILLMCLPTNFYSQRRASEDEQRDNRRNLEERLQRESNWQRQSSVVETATLRKNIEDANKKRFLNGMPQPTKEDLEQIAVTKEDRDLFNAVLKQKNTGIFKLFDALDCDEENYLLDARQNCPNGFIGKATSYSFRVKKYRERSFSDVFLENEKIAARGFNVFGIMTDLGEISLESANLSIPGVKELATMQPATKYDDIKLHMKLIQKGVQVGDYIYRSSLQLKPNHTYLLRSIAYQSKAMPDINKTFFTFESWSKDKRDDVIVIFKCVRKNEDNSWVLVWKELSRTDAPEL